jgi:hypothetical protein
MTISATLGLHIVNSKGSSEASPLLLEPGFREMIAMLLIFRRTPVLAFYWLNAAK